MFSGFRLPARSRRLGHVTSVGVCAAHHWARGSPITMFSVDVRVGPGLTSISLNGHHSNLLGARCATLLPYCTLCRSSSAPANDPSSSLPN